jgi:hypothetical protein
MQRLWKLHLLLHACKGLDAYEVHTTGPCLEQRYREWPIDHDHENSMAVLNQIYQVFGFSLDAAS